MAYGLLMALVVRFVHFALFEEVLFSLKNYLVDSTIVLVAGFAGYHSARRRQMAENYNWLPR